MSITCYLLLPAAVRVILLQPPAEPGQAETMVARGEMGTTESKWSRYKKTEDPLGNAPLQSLTLEINGKSYSDTKAKNYKSQEMYLCSPTSPTSQLKKLSRLILESRSSKIITQQISLSCSCESSWSPTSQHKNIPRLVFD